MEADDVCLLKQLEEEKLKLKRVIADLAGNLQALKNLLGNGRWFLAAPVAVALTLSCSPVEGPQNQPPVVVIQTPLRRQAIPIGAPVEVVVSATDADGEVDRVRFSVDGVPMGDLTTPPFSWSWTPSDTTSRFPLLRAVARDQEGDTAFDTLTVETNWVYTPPEVGTDGWESAALQDVGMAPERFEALMDELRGDPDHLIHSILVARSGRLVFEEYFPGLSHPTYGEVPVAFDRGTRHCLSSVTKSITSTLLGIAVGEGIISGLDAPILDFFPYLSELEITDRRYITLEHLVTMTAGLEWDEWSFPFSDPRNDLGRFNQIAPLSDQHAVRYVLEKPIVAVPGARLIYSGGNANVLGQAIQEATGTRLDRFAEEHLFEPLGITDALWWLFSDTFVYASGDISLRPRDALKIGQLYLQGGYWEGRSIVPEDWVSASTTAFSTFPFPDPANNNIGYGYGWWIKGNSYGDNAFNASGWGGQDIVVMPEWDLVVVVTGGGYSVAPRYTAHQIIQQVILPAMGG